MSDLFVEKPSDAQTKALAIDAILFDHYDGPFIFFSTKDALSQMVSALLSHRTKNAVTGKAYRQLREAYPTWQKVIDAPVEKVEEAIKMVTFPEVKAPRIQQALALVAKLNDGKLSLDFMKNWPVEKARTWLEAIPGIGVKTSAAILNFSQLRMRALVVDTHHLRVAQRLGIIPAKCSLDKGARLLESYLPAAWDGQRVYDSHQGFMRHGQKRCHWKQPNCKDCPVKDLCDYFESEFGRSVAEKEEV